jgi:hypothetical protein
MAQLDWRTLDLDAGVLREPIPEGPRTGLHGGALQKTGTSLGYGGKNGGVSDH